MNNADDFIVPDKFEKAFKILDEAMKSLDTYDLNENFANLKDYFKKEYEEYEKVKYEDNDLISCFYFPMLQDVYVQCLSQAKKNSSDKFKMQEAIIGAYGEIEHWKKQFEER